MSITELYELEKELIKEKYESEIKTLRQESEYGSIGDMDWLKETTSISSPGLVKELILYPFRDELERKVVYYPSGKGKPWRVNKWRFKEWLNNNFERIDW